MVLRGNAGLAQCGESGGWQGIEDVNIPMADWKSDGWAGKMDEDINQ